MSLDETCTNDPRMHFISSEAKNGRKPTYGPEQFKVPGDKMTKNGLFQWNLGLFLKNIF